MNQVQVLLLDLNRNSNLADILLETICPSSESRLQFLRESVADMEMDTIIEQLPKKLEKTNPSLIFLCLGQDLMDQASSLIQSIREFLPVTPVMVLIESAEPDRIFELLKLRAVDFIIPPLNSVEILPRIWRLLEQARWRESLVQNFKEKYGCKQLIGESPVFLREVEKVTLMASCDTNVLISGETGTGKEMFARAIHYLSPRANKPFIAVNCGAIPTDLMESELFGHERGAFTGATTSRLGIIHEARGGTLFLDEVDSLPLMAQVKLLRFLQEKEYRSLGSSKVCKVDVRVIAASNVDFEEAVKSGKLRQDLYYRLNVIPINLPALRDRPEDIPLLARHFLKRYTAEFDKEISNFSSEAMQKLMLHDWPGNVRELEHVVERAVIFCDQEMIQSNNISLPQTAAPAPQKSFQQMKAELITEFERRYIRGLLMAYGGNISRAAQAAQKDRRAFWHLITKHKIDVQSIRQNIRA